MKKNIFFSMLAATVLLASCSQTDDLLPPAPETGKVTFTAYIDGNSTNNLRSASTRADDATDDATDDVINRAVLEVHDTDGIVGERINGVISEDKKSIQFEVELEKTKTYTCYFWADGGEGTFNIDDLKAITVGANPSIAYFANEEITAASDTKDIILTHAVAKVVLDEIEDGRGLAVGDKVGLSFTLGQCTFDVSTGDCQVTPDNIRADTFSKEITIATAGVTGEILSLYCFSRSSHVLVTEMDITYKTDGAELQTLTIPYVHVQINNRTILRGPFEEIGALPNYTFNVTLNKDWEGDNNVGDPEEETP